MFFVFGISNGEKKLDYIQTMLCPRCGQFGRLEIYMTYLYFSLFFIPIFRWRKRYYVKSSCCNTVFELDIELGKRIQRGEKLNLTGMDLHAVRREEGPTSEIHCSNCGYPITSDFDFCPKCGRKINNTL